MKRFLTLSASGVFAGGVMLTVLSGVTALPADAIQKAPIQTVVEQSHVDINGVGAGHGWYSHSTEVADVVLTPQLAVRDITTSAVGTTGKPNVAVEHLYIVNGNSYTKAAGATKYTEKILTAAALASAADQFSPYFIEAKFDVIGGIELVGTRHYHVAGSGAKFDAFLDAAFGVTGKTLTRYAIGEITVDFWVNASGQPVKITVAGASPTDPLTASETFTSYNQSLNISAPSTPASS